MPRDLLLALDNGTQSVRALLFDAEGNVAGRSQIALTNYLSSQPGRHEHDAHVFWLALCRACRALFADVPGSTARIAAVALTTQRATMINLDARGEPLRPAITWLDQRKSPQLPTLPAHWKAAFAAAGVTKTIAYLQREAEANWLYYEQPEIWKATHKYLFLSGYLHYKLCGRFVDSTASQVGYVPFDYKRMRWASRRDWKWFAVQVRPDMLPDLCAPGSILGEISRAASSESGIPEGLPIVASATDKACEALGAGCIDSRTAALSYGTAATINILSKRYIEATPFLPPYPAAVPDTYTIEVQVYRGYWMVRWFMEQFAIDDERDLDAMLAAVPPGSLGLMLQPFWSPGLKLPGPEAKGAMIGFGDVHGRPHMYRALLEGIAYALREGKERIERRTKKPVSRLRVAGGGSQSDAAMQLTADVFGLPAERPHLYETSALGAAIDAAVGIRMHPSYSAAVDAMTRVARTFEPSPHATTMYDALYSRVYRKLYGRLKPAYEALREITNYPPY